MTCDSMKVLDLFSLSPQQAGPGADTKAEEAGGSSVKSVLDNLPDLWDEDQYSEEYDMDNFIKNLK